MTKLLTRPEIEAWATANYEESYLAYRIIECWDDEDYEDRMTMKDLLSLQDAVDEQCRAARCDMY